ncbi:DUF6427 family protein [Aquimarina spongiae]|uniref:EpsG family protein n=1 Tax=Aquimarina spongiae TaxID=570521 RepID=A0A1M6F967_9FLAO|nr:hypothetical protein SAMN04488508_104156 [Aquimarina spongiae]
MLSSFFSKSKPINYVVVALYMFLLYGIAHYKKGIVLESKEIFLLIIGLAFYILPMLLLNFILQRNDITEKGSYTILIYGFLTGVLPHALTDINVLLASGFILVGFRNVIRLRNEKEIKAKILNASLCIGLASLAYFWSIAFIVLVYVGVLYFDSKNYRNWIIPIIGVLTIYLFANCFTLLFYDSFYNYSEYLDVASLSFQNYLVKDQLFSLGTLSICILFFLALYLIKYSRKAANIKPVLRLIIAYLVIAVGIAVIAPAKNTSEVFFLCIPLAIMGTTYLEMNYNMLAKEINIWVFLLIPFTMLLF